MTNLKIVPKGTSPVELFRPDSYSQIIGQERAKSHLRSLSKGCLSTGKPLIHCLVTGPTGCGKTVLAETTAAENGVRLHKFVANPDLGREEICIRLSKMKAGDLMFIDEAQSLRQPVQEVFYQAIDLGTIPGEAIMSNEDHVPLAPFTLMFASNYPGRLKKELRNRLARIELDEYSPGELSQIGRQALGDQIMEEDQLLRLVQACHGVPRELLTMIRDLILLACGGKEITSGHVDELFAYRKIGPEGLGKYQVEILRYLQTQVKNTAKLGILADRLGLDDIYVRKEIEPVLLGKGFLAVGPQGRVLTPRGREYLRSESV